jgi:hypothetical protein
MPVSRTSGVALLRPAARDSDEGRMAGDAVLSGPLQV